MTLQIIFQCALPRACSIFALFFFYLQTVLTFTLSVKRIGSRRNILSKILFIISGLYMYVGMFCYCHVNFNLFVSLCAKFCFLVKNWFFVQNLNLKFLILVKIGPLFKTELH